LLLLFIGKALPPGSEELDEQQPREEASNMRPEGNFPPTLWVVVE
jgi:hypothetical protein